MSEPSVFSNLIEGVKTTPAESAAAMRADYSSDPRRAASQRLAAAHVRLEEAAATELAADPETAVTTTDFLRRLHRDLYRDVPESERVIQSPAGRESIVVPGELRGEDVTIGSHKAPPFAALPRLLDRFHEAYRPEAHGEVQRVIAFAASHHRLAWIHPFLDGNGRVARLMTTMYARRIGLDSVGLWSVSRGFARYRKEYYATLSAADDAVLAGERAHLARGAVGAVAGWHCRVREPSGVRASRVSGACGEGGVPRSPCNVAALVAALHRRRDVRARLEIGKIEEPAAIGPLEQDSVPADLSGRAVVCGD